MNPLSIAYVSADRGVPVGGTKGASIHVRGVAEALVRRGHEVHLLAARTDPEADGFASQVRGVPFDRVLKNVRRSVAEAGSDAALARDLHGLMLNECFARELGLLADKTRIDAVYERYSLWSWAGYRFAREHGLPWILEVNAPLVEEERTYREIRLEETAIGIENILLREADAIVVPAAELAHYIQDRVGPRSGIVVEPNGVDFALLDAAPSPPAEFAALLRDRFVVAFAGSLKPWHGIDRLLRAFDRLRADVPDAHLLVVGDGPLGPQVESAVKRHGTERITWTGAVPHGEVLGWLRCADVGVAPYPVLDRFYFSPLKVVEYLACGLPVVASDLGQLRQLVRPNETGLLVPPGDVRALAGALQRLAEDRHLRKSMGRRALARARGHHSWDRVAQRIERLFIRRLPRNRAEAPRKRTA